MSSLIAYILCVPEGIVGSLSVAFIFPLYFSSLGEQVHILFYSWCQVSSSSFFGFKYIYICFSAGPVVSDETINEQ